jgi:hypothetical protein
MEIIDFNQIYQFLMFFFVFVNNIEFIIIYTKKKFNRTATKKTFQFWLIKEK